MNFIVFNKLVSETELFRQDFLLAHQAQETQDFCGVNFPDFKTNFIGNNKDNFEIKLYTN